MATKRMTGQDYRREWNTIKQNEKSLDAHLTERVIELGNIHPDAVITTIGDTKIKATCLTKQWVESLKPIERIEIIETIEEWSEKQSRVVQLKI